MTAERVTDLAGRKVILCVCGGIAAYKVAFVARELAQLGADVRVVMTRSAQRFVGPQTFAALTGNPVYTELFGAGADVPHVELARGAELLIVAPATANAIAKMANGFSDDLFSATVLTASCPVLVAPAMHTEMWENHATQANVESLSGRGVWFAGPTSGALSSGDEGPGRMAEPDEIVTDALRLLGRSQELAGRTFIVTAGGTQEPIDPVRFIGNRSSGLMGIEIADEAAHRGAKVTLVIGPSNLTLPKGVDVVKVKTADEMRDEVFRRAPDADVIVKAAAVADWRADAHADKKLKKADGPPPIHLVPTPDILAELGHSLDVRKLGSLLIGFAAETEPDPTRLGELATRKREQKGADLIVANDVSSPDSGFEVPTNRAVIAGPDGVADVGLVTKHDLAAALVDRVASLLQARA
ncbi:MAG: phosphopantothenoylcysteine decarboxylase / phosphopantothenate---cysteine ligase [Actinomycetota bacterium]|jgi:phosphopantothenoylcysteine decarboxylase/phosphopantothenate--cysteine ligase|nr:phosphopantothenoylcysteine decarboxylase / phosphopantothenate---cysteine ligase [Actinomycetota bacterium]